MKYRTKKGTFKPTRLDRIGVKPNTSVDEDHPLRGYDEPDNINKQSVVIEEREVNGRTLVRVSVYEYTKRNLDGKPWVRTEHRFNPKSKLNDRCRTIGMEMVKLTVSNLYNKNSREVSWNHPSGGIDTDLAEDLSYLLLWAADCADMEDNEKN
jgi:hypothetical protein